MNTQGADVIVDRECDLLPPCEPVVANEWVTVARGGHTQRGRTPETVSCHPNYCSSVILLRHYPERNTCEMSSHLFPPYPIDSVDELLCHLSLLREGLCE